MSKYAFCLHLFCFIAVWGNASAKEQDLKGAGIEINMHADDIEHGHTHKHGHENGSAANSFSGSIQLGAFFQNTDSQLKADSQNATTTTLERKARNFNFVEPFLLLDLKYHVNAGDSIYLKTPYEDDEYGLAIGSRTGLAQESILDLSFFSSLYGEVWEDPYITNTAREETDMTQMGGEIRYEHIAGARLNLGYKYKSMDVDTDLIGARFHDLERDGNIHIGSIGYEFGSDTEQRLVPEFRYTLADMHGKSNRYDGYAVTLQYGRMSERYLLELSASGGVENYDAKHPLFDKVRKDDTYRTNIMLAWLRPFGFAKYLFIIGMEMSMINSNIDFFDNTTLACFTMMGYEL